MELMAKQKELKKQYALPKMFWIILTIVIIVIVSTFGWFLFWRTGWPDYIQALSKCNDRPPIVASSFIASTYTKPGDKSYKIPAGPSNTYFCTENEAITAGYKHALDYSRTQR